MLFDDKDLSVFDNDSEKGLFLEVVQTYCTKNYRASVVSLYSLVLLDLYNKLLYMAEEEEQKAKAELNIVNKLIEEEERYSSVEKTISEFFKQNYSLHFNKFINDLNYLKVMRDDCSHLKVNSTSLFTPKDYQVRMLICSMYENLFSVKAPFLDDLFSYTKDDIERMASESSDVTAFSKDLQYYKKYEKKFFTRMTQTSIVKSLNTFIKLLFISEDPDAKKNAIGLFIILGCLLVYIDSNGMGVICSEDEKLMSTIAKIELDTIISNPVQSDCFFYLICSSRWFCEIFKKDDSFIGLVEKKICETSDFFYYKQVFPEKADSVWQFYLDTKTNLPGYYRDKRYLFLRDEKGFSENEFIKIEMSLVPDYYGFDDADGFMSFFFKYFESFSNDSIVIVLEGYSSNDQFYKRRRGEYDARRFIEMVKNKDMNIDWEKYPFFARLMEK